jgi:uncharacterized damage-inducible protein DinB
MAIKDALLPEFDHETATTRRLLERVPEGALGWGPHAKSMKLGELTVHLTNLLQWCSLIVERPDFDLGSVAPEDRPAAATSVSQLLSTFDAKATAARAALAGAGDSVLLAPWTLRNAGHEIFTMPRVAALRSFVMNHMIHHRGQLSVYLRLQDVPLPSIYGPTADEA